MKNRTDHEKRRSRFTRKFNRCLASAACVLGVAAVCFGVAGYQNRIHAEDNQVLTRGVINSLGQIPQTKKTMYDNDDDQYMHALGTKENPFLILEVVPYEEYATFGYHISGCEPVDPKTNYGHGDAMGLTNTLKTAKATPQRDGIDPAHFFEDEPESKPDAYDNDKVPVKDGGSINQSYEGYYEMVEDGQGTFMQDDSGRISKGTDADKEKRNIIWHTVCTTEKQAKFADKTFTNARDSYEILKNVGDRIYTKRVSTNEDQAYVTYGYYYYQNNDDFIKYSLLQKKAGEEIDQDEVDNYCVIIKTITPKELNDNPKWADYADLYFVSRSDYQGGTTAEIWKKYNRLNHTSNTTTYTNSFANTDSDKNRDISWEVAEKIFNKVTADKNYAGMIMGSSVYSVDSYEGSTKPGTDMQLYDWNLKKLYNEVDNKYATVSSGTKSNANMFKLSLMLLSMDTDLFKDLYMNKDKLIKDGEFLLRDGDDRTYWSKTTFLLMDSTDVANLRDPYKYWTSDESWEKYGIAVELSSYRVWVKGHFYSFNDDNSITFDYTQTASKPDSKFTDYQDYLDKFYNKKDSGGTPSDSVRYILGDRNKYENRITGELNILDIEPCYDSKNGYSLQESYIRMMIPKFRGTINITHMTTAEFIGSAQDLNSTYNMIFMGLDQGAYSTEAATIDGKNGIYTYWNDYSMKGKIYFHTGDKMTGANYTKDARSRSVEFLYSATNENNVVSGQELRFPGNDITKIKQAELEDFLKAGYPIVAVPYLYDTDSLRIDQYSNICKFIKKNRSSSDKKTTLLKTSDISGIYSVVKESHAKVEFTKLPEKYNGDTGSGTKVTNPNYLSRDSSQRSLMTFGFKVDDKANKTYSYRIYLDQNQDGKFADDELYYTGKKFKANDGEQTVTCKLSKLYYGLIQWKIEIYEVKANANDRSVRFVKTGCSAAKNMAGLGKKVINVLQIMPKGSNESYDGKLDLSTDERFKKYYSELEDYSINITSISLDQFEQKFKNKPFTSYDYSKTLTDEDYDNISKDLSTDQQQLYSYHMYIIGFGDTYAGKNLDNTYGMVDFLKFYIASGKSVLFTHDLTSMHNEKAENFGYSANTLLRDVMGMNRYKAISKNVSDKNQLIQYQKGISYDTVTDVNGNELDQKHGFTYYAMKRLGWTNIPQNYNKDQKVPYQYMITSSKDGTPICNIGEIAHTGFNNTNDLTTKVEQSNQGQITEYPYKIDKSFTISDTHAQWYQLDMEDPEVTVWYTLADDGKHVVCDGESNGTGTAVTYGVSPKDVANNYYIYSKGNVFYSGVGHSTITQDMEAKLFINTMIAAYRASYEPPMVEILNPDAELLDVNTMNYQMTANDEYNDEAATSASGKVQFEGQGADNDDYIKVRFSPVELNAISTTLTCSIYYEADGATHYAQRIYDADTDAEIVSTLQDGKCVYEGVQNMHEYYFYYPKKYLNEWKDGSTTKSARRTINFYIKNNKAKLPRYQTLDMSVRALFKLD